VTEQAAKLTVKVKLHAAQPVVVPTHAPPARLSKLKVTLGVLILLLLTAAGYLLWQQFVGKVPSAVAADHATVDAAAIKAGADVDSVVAQNDDKQSDDKQNPAPIDVGTNPQATIVTVPAEQPVEPKNEERQPDITATQFDNQNNNVTTTLAEQDRTTTVAENAETQTGRSSRNLPKGFSRIVLAATMEQLEPGAAIDKLVAQHQIQRLYLFTELKGYAGQQLIHRWSFAGQVQTEALLTIEDSPWRTYSEQWLLPDQLGNWRVEIVDQQQQVLYQHDFLYQ